jgi:citrate lyase beta subunit
MAGCRIYQWSPVLPPRTIDRLGSMVARAGGVLALDLEDGLATPLASGRIAANREQARAWLVQFFKCRRGDGRQHCIRINHAGTADFEKDIAALSDIGMFVEWETVFLPKVATSSDIYTARRNLLRSGIAYRTLCPIVESCAGLDGLEEILESCVQSDVEFVQFGHYDYSLDREDWPFVRQSEQRFWEPVTRIIRSAEKHGCRYCHTPYGNLADAAGLTAIIGKLDRLCTSPFGMASLSINQTRTIAKANGGGPHPALCLSAERTMVAEHMQLLAQMLVENYIRNSAEDRSFFVDSRDSEFISPHEYLAAVRFLQKTEHVHAA